MATDKTKLNIHQRLINVQKKVTTVLKNEKVSMGGNNNYKAVSHDDVARLLHIPLSEEGIVLLPDVIYHKITSFEKEKTWNGTVTKTTWYRCDLEINVKWINADNPTDFIESHSASFALDTSDKCFAKAYSLALKICLLKVHLLESRDQEEERVFEKEPPQANNQTTRKAPPAKKLPPKEKSKVNELLHLVKTLGVSKHLMPNVIESAIGEKKKSNELSPLEIDQVMSFMTKNYS